MVEEVRTWTVVEDAGTWSVVENQAIWLVGEATEISSVMEAAETSSVENFLEFLQWCQNPRFLRRCQLSGFGRQELFLQRWWCHQSCFFAKTFAFGRHGLFQKTERNRRRGRGGFIGRKCILTVLF